MPSLRDGMSQVSKSTHGNNSWAETYGRQMATLIKEYSAKAPRSVQKHLGPSELGSPCDRQVTGKMAGNSAAPRTNNVSDPWASIMGTAGHAYVEDMYKWDNQRRIETGTYPRWIPETRVTPDPVRLPDGSFIPGADSHPGTADLYDAENRALVDHKFLGDTSRAKLIAKGPKRVYYVQLLLYRRGYQYLGLPVDRIVLLAWPRTKSSLDELYVWTHVPDDADEKLVDQVLEDTRRRQELAELVKAGQLSLMDVPATPSADDCMFCPFFRPQAAYDSKWGCPGTMTGKKA